MAPIAFVAGVVIAGASYPGYDHARQVISELAVADSPVARIQNISFVVFGVLIVAFARGLHLGVHGVDRSVSGPLLIASSGSANVVEAFLPCDRGCELVSLVGSLHDWIAMFAFLSAITGIFLLSRRLGGDPEWGRAYQRYSVLTAGAAFVALAVWLAIGAPAPPWMPRIFPRVPGANGTLQRVCVALVLVWIEVIALRLVRLMQASPDRGGQ